MTRPADTGKAHVSHDIGHATAHVRLTWLPDTPIADIEESAKAATRAAIQEARQKLGVH